MMESAQDPLAKLIFEFSKLPGVGEKSATRLAYHVLHQNPQFAQNLADSILEAKTKIQFCSSCFNFTDQDPCKTCANSRRNPGLICIVERPADVQLIENSLSYSGTFHILHGLLSPLEGIGPDQLRLDHLLRRISTLRQEGLDVEEIILALNPSVEGDATAMYISRLLTPQGIKVTKIAHGIPVGGQLEYSDRQTISKALENRVEIF